MFKQVMQKVLQNKVIMSILKSSKLLEKRNNIELKYKLIALISIFTVSMIGIGIIAASYITKINNNAESMYENNMMANLYLSQLSEKNLELSKLEVEYVLSDYTMDTTEIRNNISIVQASMPYIYNKLIALKLSSYTIEKLEEYTETYKNTLAERALVEERVIDNRKLEAYMYYQKKLSPERQKLGKIITDLLDHNISESENANADNMKSAKRATLWMLVIMLVLTGISFITFIHIYIHIKGPISLLSKEMEKVKQGNLDIEIKYLYDNELGRLSKDFIAMTNEINSMVSQMKKNAEQVANNSSELLEDTTQMRKFSANMTSEITAVAQQAEVQVQHMNESVRAMEEVAKGISRINESTMDVAELSTQASEFAFNGKETMQAIHQQMQSILQGSNETYNAIDQFTKTSNEISKFVSTIDEISHQVQLLSLNASIEAARAGEHGRGFSVVASEVRDLAEHTKVASSSIAKMVKAIQAQSLSAVKVVEKEQLEVTRGMQDVISSEAIFNQITNAVQTINAQLQEVSAATEQMSASAEEVTSSLQEVSHLSDSSSKQALHVAELAKQQQYVTGDIQTLTEQLDSIADSLKVESEKFNTKQ